jgi:hypothetical protein
MKLISLGLFITALIFQSCETKTEEQIERQIEIEKVEDKSIEILVKIKTEIELSDIKNNIVWKINMDSVQSEWQKIQNDSAELGLIYLQNIDSIYQIKSAVLNQKSKKEKEKKLKESIVKLEKLKQKFTYKKDEFQDIGFYTHKRWGKYWPNRKTLTSGVNSSGYAWLRSNYSDDDWLFHTSIYVLIGNRKLTSPTVETYSDKNITDNDGGRIWEVVTYDNTDILREIAENIDQTIKIRFNGREFYNDATLNSGDKQALKDCYNLGELLKLIK